MFREGQSTIIQRADYRPPAYWIDSVDLITAAGRRLRARFDDDCRAIDFYAGFYLKRTVDGMLCAKRDAIRSRSGDFCRIEAFKQLRAKR